MALKVLTSAEEAGGPKNLRLKIFFMLLHGNNRQPHDFCRKYQKVKKSTHPRVYAVPKL
jgi:hypothetical protein